MKILITGGSGMVGRNLLKAADMEGVDTVAPSSRDMNLLDVDSIRRCVVKERPDVIIHCAGLVGGIQANIKRPFEFARLNTLMGINLLEVAIELEIDKLLNIASSCMYPRNAQGLLEESSILSAPLEPTNEGYALSKILISRMCEYAKTQYGFDYKTIIPCNLYGPHDKFDPSHSHMIPAVLRKLHLAKMSNENTTDIWGDGAARREFMYVGDLAEFCFFALGNYEKLDSYTNVGLGFDYSINEYYMEIAKTVGYTGSFIHDLSKPVGMAKKLVSVEKTKALNWRSSTSLEQGLAKTYEFFLNEVN